MKFDLFEIMRSRRLCAPIAQRSKHPEAYVGVFQELDDRITKLCDRDGLSVDDAWNAYEQVKVMTDAQREEVVRRLFRYLRDPKQRSFEEGIPVLVLKNGKHIMIERTAPGYTVSLDMGCTCREIGRVGTIDGVADLVWYSGYTE